MHAIPRPAPRVAPATTATLPSRLFIFHLLVGIRYGLIPDTPCHIWAAKILSGRWDDACRPAAFHHAALADLPAADRGRVGAPAGGVGADHPPRHGGALDGGCARHSLTWDGRRLGAR